LLIGAVSELMGAANAILFQGIFAVIITILFVYFLRRNK